MEYTYFPNAFFVIFHTLLVLMFIFGMHVHMCTHSNLLLQS